MALSNIMSESWTEQFGFVACKPFLDELRGAKGSGSVFLEAYSTIIYVHICKFDAKAATLLPTYPQAMGDNYPYGSFWVNEAYKLTSAWNG